MRKRKKGSSFVIVLAITSMIFVVGASVLAMVASDYKNRINESKKVQNLYEADSGLDIVYNLIMKNSEAAIIEANTVVEKLDTTDEGKSEKFKDEFMKFLGIISIPEENILNITESDAPLAQSIAGFKYKQKGTGGNWLWASITPPEATVELTSYVYDNTVDNKSITIGVRSTFASAGDTNKKTVQTTFTVKAPDYTDSNINIYPVYDKKIITADGDLSIDANLPAVVDSTTGEPINNLTKIEGDVWVQGKGVTTNNSEDAFNKYTGGITLTNSVMNLTGNMYTDRSLSIDNNAQAKITGNVYGVNAYLGHESGTGTNKLEIVGDLITDNDLTLNATNGRALMTNFYGINDKNISNITDADIDTDNDIKIAARNSSSIIINKENGNSLKIDDKAYIMGVAYLDTQEKYQTGESIAVKGNYLAYTYLLPNYPNEVELKYYNPLQLISKIDGTDATLEQKADYFDEYYATAGNDVNTSEIEIGQVIATGTYVNTTTNTTAIVPSVMEVNAAMDSKREDFATNVLCMGDINGVINDDLLNRSDIYTRGVQQKTVGSQINFDAIPSIDISSTSAKIIKSADDVTVDGNTISYNSKNENFNSDTNLLIFTTGKVIIKGNTNMKSLIIAENGIDISGNLEFTGNIITAGDIKITGSDVKNLTYDADFTREVIASNYKIFSNVFVGSPKNESVNMGTNMYNVEDCITKGTWRILK
ncbi:hypothetical protein [Clostridium vincentii]|uniref:Uncharacterized protein n=1 Tax=Clostridium vincentii TaxID=52704 RepID=A0A2T0BCC2_9CLOT|nr:hypothetical protein [Clostridium vincentii]PRR81457.1 hypothetical protein CLVI_24840 [Clostridium vincentii]